MHISPDNTRPGFLVQIGLIKICENGRIFLHLSNN